MAEPRERGRAPSPRGAGGGADRRASPRVVVVGDVNLDVIVRPEGDLMPGADRRAAIGLHMGGSGANAAAWLAALGVDAVLAARVGGADRPRLERELAALGVIPRLAGDAAVATGVVVSLIDPDGGRSFLADRGANLALDAADLPDTLLDGATLLHVSGYSLFAARPRAAVLDLAARAAWRGIPFTVDPGSSSFLEEVGPAAFLGWTAGAAICFPNDDEAAVLAGSRDPALQRRCLSKHYDLTAIKRGPLGAEVVGRGGALLAGAPAPAAAVLDTTGAGDAFLAGFLAARLRGAPLAECVREGVDAGSAATEIVGAAPAPRAAAGA